MILLYNALLVPLVLLAIPVALLAVPFSPRLRGGLLERLRPLPRADSRAPRPEGGRANARANAVWIHAASVGEAEACAPLVEALRERGMSVLATTSTLTGRARLRARFPGLRVRLAPLDLPGLVHASLWRSRVGTLVLIETEIWPNLIHAAVGAGVRVVMAGARISDRSFPRYRWLRPLIAPLLRRVARVGARSEQDRQRLLALGASAERTVVVGDLKLDRPAPAAPGPELRAALGPGPFFVAGSTHPGEEEAVLSAWQALRETGDALRLVLAPRHPERVAEVLKTVRRHGATPGLRSQGAADAPVVVVDTIGELGAIYALAELVFVGGSLAHVGGHNLLEPVQAGCVVMHGPHVENQRTQQALLAPLDVLRPVDGAVGLARTLAALWRDPERNVPARDAARALREHTGATRRCLALILDRKPDDA